MKVTIIALGRLGQYIYHELADLAVSGSYYSKPKNLKNEYFFDFKTLNYPSQLESADLIILNLTPSTLKDLELFKKFCSDHKHKKILFVSSTSVYGQSGRLNEIDIPYPSTDNGKFLLACEKILLELKDSWVIRPAGLYDDHSHPAHYLSRSGLIQAAEQPVNLIHRKEVAELIKKLVMQSEIRILNAVNVHHPFKKDYYLDYCKRHGLALPDVEMSHEKLRQIDTAYSDYKIHSLL